MASTLLHKILNKANNFTTASSIFTRTLQTVAAKSRGGRAQDNLYRRISPLGQPGTSLVPVLDQWVREGNKVKAYELQFIVRDLRSRRRYTQALEVSEWMSKSSLSVSVSDHAVRLDLIGKTQGSESAESYFNSLNDIDKVDKTYGALLNCYVREGLVDKALSLMQKMKEMRFAANILIYNNLICLYSRIGQFEKVSEAFAEMKENGVSPDNFTYRICMNAYGAQSDIISMEGILKEMESRSHFTIDWLTYSTVANLYIKTGVKEKAVIYLKKCEEALSKDALGYNHLISHYASLGNKDEMMRLWGLLKTQNKRLINRDYITILGSLVKIDELEEAEKILSEWDSSCYFYDVRVPNVLLIGYSQKGMVEKSEAILRDIIRKGKTPAPNSWSILAAGFMDKQNMEKAFECMKEALAVHKENKLWRPKPELVSSILNWADENKDVDEVEAFVTSLKSVIQESTE